MLHKEFPLVHELLKQNTEPGAYFNYFKTAICAPDACKRWASYERAFKKLEQHDSEAWAFLKNEARPHLIKHDRDGWYSLINILNQAFAYNHLIKKMYCNVHFVPRNPRNEQKTPDIEGKKADGTMVLCEVKTIDTSDKELKKRCEIKAQSPNMSLDSGFFKKLCSDLKTAKCQCKSYDKTHDAIDKTHDAIYIVFVVLNFDDFIGEYNHCYYAQIDAYLECNPVVSGIQIVFFNRRTPSGQQHIPMRNAEVINEE